MNKVLISLWLILGFALSSAAQISTQDIDEAAREVGQSLRCVVCQNQSINESDAPLAEDMRNLVRKQLGEGKSKAEVIAYMQTTYGDYVLLKPPVQTNTIFLWFGPFILLTLLFLWFFKQTRKTEDKEGQE